jgi:glycerophosphoryl diester phosphodiesterase
MFRLSLAIINLLNAGILLLMLLFALFQHQLPVWQVPLPTAISVAVMVLNFWAYLRLRGSRRIGLLRQVPWLIFAVMGLLVAIFHLLVAYVDMHLEQRAEKPLYNECHKVWAARGLVEGGHEITHTGEQNSIESITRAFSRGAPGVEVDVHFDTDSGRFIVSHDYPYNLKNGAILTLEELFSATGNNYYFWLDFKKLRHLGDADLVRSVSELERLSQKFDLKSKLYVEGEAPFSLAVYRNAGFNTIFDTHPINDDHPLATTVINLYKLVYYFGHFDVMGMNYYFGDGRDPIYGSRTRRLLAGIPVFIYHVPDDPAILRELVLDTAVRVILVLHHNLDRYGFNACLADQ